MHKRKQGFTLIELLVVIVILGILAAVAIPKFIDLRGEARVATVEGLKGALKAGANIVHAKAVVQGLDSGNQTLTLNGGSISVRAGYPRVANSCTNFTSQLTYWISLNIDASICSGGNDADWYGVVALNAFHFMPANYSSIAENCFVTYTTASKFVAGSWVDAESASIVSETSGCDQ